MMSLLSGIKYTSLVLFFALSTCALSAQVGGLLYQEDFNNLDNWIISTGNGNWGWGNGELQFYKEENVNIVEIPGEPGNNGVKLTAMVESGPGITDVWGNPLNYTSGKITSLSGLSVQHGMVEARVRVPDLDLGGWPAFWMLGTSNLNWPTKGEIDLMEMGAKQSFRDMHDTHNGGNGMNNSTVNEMTGSNVIYFDEAAVNGGNPNGVVSIANDPNDDFNRPYYNHVNPFNDRFLIHRVYWDENSIKFTVEDDGVEYDLYTEEFTLGAGTEAFLKPFYFLTNLAIGGSYTDAYNLGDTGSGAPISLDLPADMYIDYIKIYEWNGQGDVHLGPPNEISGTFGVYTDETPVNDAHEIDEDAFVFVWENTLNEGSELPLEGDNVLSWSTNGLGWFGAGVLSEQPINLSAFQNGHVTFSVKAPANMAFQIGVTDAWDNQHYVDFPAGQSTYGLERNGEWGQASIPVADLIGEDIDLRMMAYTFVILEVNGGAGNVALDDIYWEGGVTSLVDAEESMLFDLRVFPQPANDLTQIQFTLANETDINLAVFDLMGREVETIRQGSLSAGAHSATWNSSDFSSGLYIVKLSAGNRNETQRIIIQR